MRPEIREYRHMIIVPFVPKHEKETEENLVSYIQYIKDNTVFFREGNGVNWNDDRWDLTQFYPTTGNVKTIAIFTDMGPRRGKPYPQPFMDEAKAVLSDYLRQSKTRQVSRIISILRDIYKYIPASETRKTINSLSDIELYAIEEAIVEKYATSYQHCRILERIVHNIIEPAKLTKSRLSWRSGQKFTVSNRNDLVGERNRISNTKNNKIPDLRCIMDLASVFNHSHLESDIIVTSWFAISMYAPSRINEILTLPVNCERYDEGTGASVHGIAWIPEKGGDPLVKRAASEESAEVARTAIRRLTELGKNARKAAKWYEENPSSLYLPKGYENLRGQPLTLYEAGMIIGKGTALPTKSAKNYGIVATTYGTVDRVRTNGAQWNRLYTFQSIERWILKKLPFGWPFADQKTKLKYSDALFTMPRNIMGNIFSTYENVPQFITDNIIMQHLGKKSPGRTIFARNKLIDPDTGQPWRLASHQPRHLLNTIAQSKHLSQELIAFWSGRKSVKQNDHYDHTSQEFIIESYLRLEENAPKELIVTGPLAEKIQARGANEPISREEALKEELAAFHITKYGYCRHDFSLTPCPKDKWCNNCGEAYFAKGDKRQIKTAEQDVAKFTRALATAKQAKADGEYGVEQWIEKLEIDLHRSSLKLEKLTDPAVEDGTLITLPPPKVSQSKAGLSMAIRETET